jgi:exopolyphosphatase/guanosine-5'-triphosphate,3'-diphosphate pyrophosphatase
VLPKPLPGETVVSLIDLGTNSVRMDVVALKNGQARRLHREKRMVRLGDGLYESGHLHPLALERVEQALADFAALHTDFAVARVSAVATAAMREAPEAPMLVQRWQQAHGIAFRVISGDEEARLIAKGVLQAERLPSGGFVLIDIGGGSTELSLCQGPKVLESFSLPLGANRLQQAHLKSVPPKRGGVDALRQAAQAALAPLHGEHRWPAVKELIGSGGSIRALRRLAKAAGAKDLPFTVHFLSDLCARLQRMDRVGLLHVPGMDEKRVDLLLAGALVLEEAALALGAQKIRATEATLRDGLLAQELERLSSPKAKEALLG